MSKIINFINNIKYGSMQIDDDVSAVNAVLRQLFSADNIGDIIVMRTRGGRNYNKLQRARIDCLDKLRYDYCYYIIKSNTGNLSIIITTAELYKMFNIIKKIGIYNINVEYGESPKQFGIWLKKIINIYGNTLGYSIKHSGKKTINHGYSYWIIKSN